MKRSMFVAALLFVLALPVVACATMYEVDSNNSNTPGSILVGTGTTFYGDQVGHWTLPQDVPALRGAPGIDGINGTNGIDGVNGIDGANGVNGTNGQDGQDVDPATVDNLHNEIYNNASACTSRGDDLQRQIDDMQRHNPVGVGLNVILFENEDRKALARDVHTEYKYDASNREHSIFLVGTINLSK